MMGQPTGHGRRLWLPTGQLGLVKVGLAQHMMAGTEVINGAQQKQGRGQSRLAFGGVPRAAGQNRQPFTKGGVEPFHVSGVDEQATMRVEQLLHDKGWRPAQDTPGPGQDSCTILSSLLDDTGDSHTQDWGKIPPERSWFPLLSW